MKLLYALLLLPAFLQAQQLQPVTSVQPDCGKFSSPIRIAGTVTTATIDNRLAACDGFVVTYSSNGFATVSVLLQSAPLGTGGIAGTFVSFAGTITAGFTNPATAITQGEIRATGYFPYVNVQITTTGTGYLQVEFHGFKTNPNSGGSGGSGSGCVGTTTTPCVVVGPTAAGSPPTTSPVLVAGQDGTNVQTILTDGNGQVREIPASISQAMTDGRTNSVHLPADINPAPFTYTGYPFAFNGSTWDRQFLCTNQALFNLSGSGNTQIIAASGSTVIRICHIDFSTTAAEDVKITQGTGASCGTGTADVTGLYKSVQSFAQDYQPTAALRSAASQAICLNQSAAQSLGGFVVFAQF